MKEEDSQRILLFRTRQTTTNHFWYLEDQHRYQPFHEALFPQEATSTTKITVMRKK